MAFLAAMKEWDVGGYTTIPRPVDGCKGYQQPSHMTEHNFTVCTATFSPGDAGPGAFDFLLGDSFFRNAYTSFVPLFTQS